jgi:glycosyltransferase involved in cell wall biosynthesis
VTTGPVGARLRVAIDGTSLIGHRTGIGHVTGQLIGALADRRDLDVSTYAVTLRGRNQLAGLVPPGVRSATTPLPARAVRRLWTRSSWPRIEAWTGPIDIVHATNYVAPPTRAATVLTVHDLTFVRFPEMCTKWTLQFDGLVRTAFARGVTVHTGSDFVADEIADVFGLAPDRIVRIAWGLAPTGGGDPAHGHALAGGPRYVLAIGQIEPRKNLPRLVRAFDAVAAGDPDLALVVAGPDGWDAENFAAARAAAHHGARIRHLGYVSDDDRRDLLAGCTVFAYPSIYEGFGLPPLEAMQAGVPVVAARAGSLPEVLGDAALYADPLDVDALAAALTRALADDTIRTELVACGRRRVQRYQWPTAADEFAALYARVAGH